MTDKQAIDHKVIFCNFDVTAGYEFTRDIEFISESTPAPGVGGGTPASTIVEAQAAYAYSPTHGRIAQVAKSPNQTFCYAYTLNSNLLATVSGPIHTVTNHWEPRKGDQQEKGVSKKRGSRKGGEGTNIDKIVITFALP